MPLTVSQIMRVAAQPMLNAEGRRYELGQIYQESNFPVYYCFLWDPNTGMFVRITWSVEDEIRLHTERERINFCSNLIQLGIRTLDRTIAQRVVNRVDAPPQQGIRMDGAPIQQAIPMPEEEVFDVDFGD